MPYEEFDGELDAPVKAGKYEAFDGELDAPAAPAGRSAADPRRLDVKSGQILAALSAKRSKASPRDSRIAEMDELDPSSPNYLPVTDDAVAALQTDARGQMDDKRTKGKGRVLDKDIPSLSAGGLAQDVLAGALQLGPTAVKGLADLARLATGDTVGKGLSEFAERGNKAIREVVGSERATLQRRRFDQDMQDPALNAADLIASNPGALSDQILPTMGSMLLPMGAGAAAGKLASSGKAAQLARAIDEATVLDRVAKAQQAAVIGTTVAQNSADTYSSIRDKGGRQDQSYLGAAIAAPLTYAAGRLTGGGAEGQLVKSLSGQIAKGGAQSIPAAMLREGGQEAAETLGQYVGETTGAGEEFSANAASKQLAVAATLGAVIGGGSAAATRPMVRLEDMPTTIVTPDEVMAMKPANDRAILGSSSAPGSRQAILDSSPATQADQSLQIAQPDAQIAGVAPLVASSQAPIAAEEAAPAAPELAVPTDESVIGAAKVPQGSMADRADQLLKARNGTSPDLRAVDPAGGGGGGAVAPLGVEAGASAGVVRTPDAGATDSGAAGVAAAPNSGGNAPSLSYAGTQRTAAPRVVEMERAVYSREEPAPDLSTDPYPTRGAAVAQAAQLGLSGRTEVVQLGKGFALAPKAPPVTIAEHRENQRAVADLQAAITSDRSGRNTADLEYVPNDVEPAIPLLATRKSARLPVGPVAFLRAVQAATGIRTALVRNLGDQGVYYNGRYFLDEATLGSNPDAINSLAIGVVGHEAMHVLERSRGRSGAAYGRLADVVGQYLRDGAVERQLDFENGSLPEGAEPRTRRYARAEVVANIGGAMWLDTKFWSRLYQLDDGSTFRRVFYAFMQQATKLTKVAAGSNFDAAKYVTNVDAVREAAAQAWAQHNGKQAPPEGDSPPSFSREDAKPTQRGLVAEVAPNPDQTDTTAGWDAMPEADKSSTTRAVANKVMGRVFDAVGVRGWGYEFGSGTFEGKASPNVLVKAAPDATNDQLDEVARVLGYVLDQKAMVAFNEDDTTSDSQAGFVKVVLPAKAPADAVEQLRAHIVRTVPQAGGDTLRDGALVYGNFSAYNGAVETLDDAAFEAAIDAAVISFPTDLRIEVTPVRRHHSAYIEPGSRDAYLEGTRYGNANQETLEAGGDGVRGRGGRGGLELLREISAEAIGLRDRWIESKRADRRQGYSGGGDGVPPAARPEKRYGVAIPGAIALDAYHYSKAKQTRLDAAYSGTGLRGADLERVRGSDDPRLRNRTYFYFATGQGIRPESGVGAHAHGVRLQNIYDADADKLGLFRSGDANARESRVIDAGFDGYSTKNFNRSGAVVLLGSHSVPVDYIGTNGGMGEPEPAGKQSLAAVGDITIEVETESGTARMTVDAEAAIASLDARAKALQMVRRCLA